MNALSGPISEWALVHAVEAVQMPILLQLQKLPGKGDGGWEKSVFASFFSVFFFFLADQKIVSSWKNAFWGIL